MKYKKSKTALNAKNFLLFFAFCLFTISYGKAAYSAAGTTALPFLKLGAGPCIDAMGDAGISIAHGAEALMFNPAGLAGEQGLLFQVAKGWWLLDTGINFIGIKGEVGKIPAGIGVLYMNLGELERRDELPTTEPLSHFEAYDAAISAGAAYRVTPSIHAGAAIKGLYEKIYVENVAGFSIDAGLNYNSPFPGLTISFAARNIGPDFGKNGKKKFPLPLSLGFGLSYKSPSVIKRFALISALEALHVRESGVKFHSGVELNIGKTLFLSTGYRIGYDADNYSAGFGVQVMDIRFQYSFHPMNQSLGNTHRIGLEIR